MSKKQINSGLVTVAVVSQLYEAVLLKAILEKENIIVFLQNEMMAQIYTNVTGGIEIQVSNIDAKKAHDLLIKGGYI